MIQVIIGFLLIIFIVIFVPLIPTSDLYGKWISEESRCIANDILNDPKNSHLYDQLTNYMLDLVRSRSKTPEEAAYRWNHGQNKKPTPKQIKNDRYVKEFNKEFKKKEQ